MAKNNATEAMTKEQLYAVLSYVFAEDHRKIAYRPRWRKATNSVLATILLQQIHYWWKTQNEQPFYKFAEPCDHHLYRPGDSWIEELGFTIEEFTTARKRIAFKRTKRNQQEAHTYPVEYRVTRERLTYYTIQKDNFYRFLEIIYQEEITNLSGKKPEINDYSLNRESRISKTGNPGLPNPGIPDYLTRESGVRYNTKTTSETNTKKEEKNLNFHFSEDDWRNACAWADERFARGDGLAWKETLMRTIREIDPTVQRSLYEITTPEAKAVVVAAWRKD